MRLAALIAAVSILLPAQAAAAREPSVASGPLVAHVEADPWHLSVTHGGRPILDEARATDPALAGTLAYSSGGAWFHATRVVAEQRTGAGPYEADLATTNPLGQIHVEIRS